MSGERDANFTGGRLPELDGLRAIAVLLVLAAHNLAYVPLDGLRRAGERGWVGVDLFFVLSGFLIGGILLDHRPALNYYRVFYLRRFLRIVPLYAVLVLPGLLVLTLGLQRYFGGHSIAGKSAMGAWLCVFFVQDFSALLHCDLPGYLVPTWSVAVEEQFYLLLPPLVRNLGRKQLLWIVLPAIAAAPLLRGLLHYAAVDRVGWVAFKILPCRWDGLLLGVICALAYRDHGFRSWFAEHLRGAQLVCLLAVGVSLAWLSATENREDPRLQILGYTMIDASLAATLLLAVMNPAGTLHGALGWAGFRPIATISYALYLLHTPMMGLFESLFHSANVSSGSVSWAHFGVSLLSLAATVLASALSWRFFESRILRLGHQHRFETGVAGLPPQPAAVQP